MAFLMLILVLWLLIFTFDSLMSKYLKVENPDFFSYNYINEKHKKIVWILRIVFLIAVVFLSYYAPINIFGYEIYSNYIPAIIIMVFWMISDSIKAFMEWKYSDNRRDYIFTLSKLAFFLVIMLSMIKLATVFPVI